MLDAGNAKYRPLWIGALALLVLPLAMRMLGLTVNTATLVVVLAIAAMGSTCWSATPGSRRSATAPGSASAPMRRRSPEALVPRPDRAADPGRDHVRRRAVRRRGLSHPAPPRVYFSLLTLALAALTYTISFRWTAVTGGEDGLGGLTRGSLGPINLDDALAITSWLRIGLGVLYALLRVTVRRSATCWSRSARTRCVPRSKAIRSSATSWRRSSSRRW